MKTPSPEIPNRQIEAPHKWNEPVMRITDTKPAGTRHPKRLFLPVNQFNFAAFPVRPRTVPFSLAGAPEARRLSRRLERKGAAPC